MTPEMIENRKVQHEQWIEQQQIECKKLALEYASRYGSGKTLVEDAKKIFDWLSESLK